MILARLAERAERYDEMADFMKERVEMSTPLDGEERDMFSAAFKGALTSRRRAVRVASGVEAQEKKDGNGATAALASGYQAKVEAELHGICATVLQLLTVNLIPSSTPGEAKTFYLKMQGDYHRYLAEVAQGDQRQRAAEDAKIAYGAGTSEAASLSSVHPVRLGLALNFSVFQHEVLGDTVGAVETAKAALKAAADNFNEIPEESRNDAYLTIQLLQDNLALWEA